MSKLTQWIGSRLIGFGQSMLGAKILSSNGRVFPLTSPEVYTAIGLENAIQKGFTDNISVYSVVMKDAKKFGSIPLYVYSSGEKEQKAYKGPHASFIKQISEVKALTKITDVRGKTAQLISLLNRPNKYESQDAFLTKVRAYFKVCGEAFIWLNRGDIKGYRLADGSFDDTVIDKLPVLEMQVLPANLITIIPDPQDLWGVLGYILDTGERLIIRAGDVIHWRNPNLNFDASSRPHLRGLTPLIPGSKTLSESEALSFASMRASQNDGAKAVIFEKSGKMQMTPTQEAQISRVLDAKINNNEVASAVAQLQGDWGVIDLSMSSKDMEMIEKKKFSWQEICFLFDVPNEFFDTQTTFANKKEALIAWVSNEIIPACKQLNGEFNRVLARSFGLEGQVIIASDYTELPEIQERIVAVAKTLLEIWPVPPDDILDFLGYDRRGGDFAEPWVPNGRTPMSKANQDDGLDDEVLAMEKKRVERGYDGDR